MVKMREETCVDDLQLVYIKSDLMEGVPSVVLNGKYNVEELTNGMIQIAREDSYINGLWGKNITDCYAVVGENGSGKTMTMHLIMELFHYLKGPATYSHKNVFVLFENTQTNELFYFSTGNEEVVFLENGRQKYIRKISAACVEDIAITKHRVAYIHNVLSQTDYEYSKSCYDFSIGGLIAHDFRMNTGMHYSGTDIDKVSNYFVQQQFQIIDFIYKVRKEDRIRIPFPLPKMVYISFADSHYNRDYIADRLGKLKWAKQDKYAVALRQFSNDMKEFWQERNNSWIDHTLRSLVINCFKELIIPQTVPGPDTSEECMYFCRCFSEILMDNDKEDNVYQLLKKFFESLECAIEKENDCIKRTACFVQWLEKNKTLIEQFERYRRGTISIPITDQTSLFMQQLIRLYCSINFAFPFYVFKFDVSSGEYNFLSLFSQIYSIIDIQNPVGNVFSYGIGETGVKNILLMIDEADISFHPRWQKNYIYFLTNFINHNLNHFNVQIIVTTHSPIMLSDFPASNVLYLSQTRTRDNKSIYRSHKNLNMKTFGCNIHSLFLNSFFLEEQGTMGLFAEKKINALVDSLLGETADIDEGNTGKMIDCLGEDLIKDRLEKFYLNKFLHPVKKDERTMDDHASEEILKLLKKQRNEIDALISQLEQGI